MFGLKRPCKTCPFRKGAGRGFGLRADRLAEIFEAPAFQCHDTVDYDAWEDGGDRAGRKPQQCAGLIALLEKEGRRNNITQVAARMMGYDPARVDGSEVYENIEECVADHGFG
jgi:hypothetical protein